MVERTGHALRGAISRDLGLLIICAWNGIACTFEAGESNSSSVHVWLVDSRAYARIVRSLVFFPSLLFLPPLILSSTLSPSLLSTSLSRTLSLRAL